MEQTKNLANLLVRGGTAVIPTDTLYGLCGSARSRKAVARIYRLRRRDLKKPMIVLIASQAVLREFGITLSRAQSSVIKKLWPGKVSIVLPVPVAKFAYLHRGAKNIAFRIPASASLRAFLKKTGPLVAPSANREGEPPAHTVAEAMLSFDNGVDCYVAGGRIRSLPSTLINVNEEGKITVLREGAVKIKKV